MNGTAIHGPMNGTTKKGKKIQIKFAPLRGLLSASNLLLVKLTE